MAAEFDVSGFSAVDKFFGNDETKNKSTISSSSATKEGHVVGSKGKRRRGGVGTSTDVDDASKKLLSSDALSKKILNVGRKRRSREDNVDDDEEDEDYIDGGDHGVNDDDDEMIDGGRTNIVEKSTLSKKGKSVAGSSDKLTNDQGIVGSKNPKKKLGKKERQRQKQQEETSAAATQVEVFEPVAENSAHEQDDETRDSAAEDTKDSAGLITHNNTEKYPGAKKKRKKVRSRQKNIYKDNRTKDEKPAHLTRGNPNYQGRPMTEATREKLNLPPPTKKIRPSYNNSSKNQDGNTLFVIDRSPDSPVGGGGDDVGVKLAIDDFMNTDDTSPSNTNKESKDDDNKDLKKKKREKSGVKKNKKNRFKNCR